MLLFGNVVRIHPLSDRLDQVQVVTDSDKQLYTSVAPSRLFHVGQTVEVATEGMRKTITQERTVELPLTGRGVRYLVRAPVIGTKGVVKKRSFLDGVVSDCIVLIRTTPVRGNICGDCGSVRKIEDFLPEVNYNVRKILESGEFEAPEHACAACLARDYVLGRLGYAGVGLPLSELEHFTLTYPKILDAQFESLEDLSEEAKQPLYPRKKLFRVGQMPRNWKMQRSVDVGGYRVYQVYPISNSCTNCRERVPIYGKEFVSELGVVAKVYLCNDCHGTPTDASLTVHGFTNGLMERQFGCALFSYWQTLAPLRRKCVFDDVTTTEEGYLSLEKDAGRMGNVRQRLFWLPPLAYATVFFTGYDAAFTPPQLGKEWKEVVSRPPPPMVRSVGPTGPTGETGPTVGPTWSLGITGPGRVISNNENDRRRLSPPPNEPIYDMIPLFVPKPKARHVVLFEQRGLNFHRVDYHSNDFPHKHQFQRWDKPTPDPRVWVDKVVIWRQYQTVAVMVYEESDAGAPHDRDRLIAWVKEGEEPTIDATPTDYTLSEYTVETCQTFYHRLAAENTVHPSVRQWWDKHPVFIQYIGKIPHTRWFRIHYRPLPMFFPHIERLERNHALVVFNHSPHEPSQRFHDPNDLLLYCKQLESFRTGMTECTTTSNRLYTCWMWRDQFTNKNAYVYIVHLERALFTAAMLPLDPSTELSICYN